MMLVHHTTLRGLLRRRDFKSESGLEILSQKAAFYSFDYLHIGAFFNMARAIATRCFSPPLNFNPLPS